MAEQAAEFAPLAEHLRPDSLDTVAGQAHLTGPAQPLRVMLDAQRLQSLIFWGPPGTGKTTLARILARGAGLPFHQLSAVTAGVKDVRRVLEAAAPVMGCRQQQVLFLDEIHRFNKAQQDALLPAMESGDVILIGATTENPSFEVNAALLSRSRVFVLRGLQTEDLLDVLQRGTAHLQRTLDADSLHAIARAADGDARRSLHLLEALDAHLQAVGRAQPTDADLEAVTAGSVRRFDKGGDAFYHQISAMHKAVRGSDPDGALYWLCRMLDGGCEPLYLARRMIRMASEDIGNADPRALTVCTDACAAWERLGSPEGDLALAHAVVYLAVAPKSNAVYAAFKRVNALIGQTGSLEVPMHLRNAPTRLMKELGHGDGYRYDPDEPGGHAAGQTYLPEAVQGQRFYAPGQQGLEAAIAEKLARLRPSRARGKTPGESPGNA